MHFLDLTPKAIARLTPAQLYRLLRPLTLADVARLTPAQCLAAASVLDPPALGGPSQRSKRLSALFLSDEERQELELAFIADVAALNDELDRGPRRGESGAQLADRLGQKFAWLLTERYTGLANGLRLPAPRGQPPEFKTKPSGRKRGPAPTFTVDDEAWLLAEVDRWRETLARKGARVSDATALRNSIVSYYYNRFLAHGLSDEAARRGARTMASRTGPVFRNRKGTLAKARARARR
jgi:hypothetical protein